MKTYRVTVREINYGTIVVQAENEDEAYEKAWDELMEGEVEWGKVHSDIEYISEEEEGV